MSAAQPGASNIATGGRAISSNGYTPVWEPFFLMNGDRLVVYYSDQRDTNHGKKLVHQVSTDGVRGQLTCHSQQLARRARG
jgi:hypothetical protein